MMKSYSSYRNSNIEPIGHLPVEWRDSKIKYTGNVICGGTPSTANDSLWGGEIPWLQSGKVQFKPIYLSDVDRFITENGLANSSTKMVKGDSVLVAITGATCSNIGYLTFDSTVNQSIVGIEPSSKYSSWYIYYFLISQKHQILISQSGGAQGGVTKEEIKNLVIPKLPLREQEHIASFLNSKTYKIDKLTQLSEHKIELLKEQRTALINHCVTKGLNPNVEMKDSGITWIGDIPKHWVTTRIKYFLYEI